MFRNLAVSLSLALGLGGAAAAASLIDDFNTAGRVQDPATPPINAAQQFSAPSALLVGGFRDLEAQRLTGASRTELETFNGNLLFSNGSGTSGIGRVTWDGDDDPTTVDTMGLGGFDITALATEPRFLIDVEFTDADLGILLTVWDVNGNSSTLSATVMATLDPIRRVFPIDEFAGTADFSNVGAIQLELSGMANLDAEISRIAIAEVPLPASAVLLLTGMLGLGYAARRRRAV